MSPVSVREGSALYYALSGLAVDKRNALLALLNVCHTLATTLNDVSEPSVAEKKIHWWHEEIERLHKGNARHPSTQAVQPLLAKYSLEPSGWLSILAVNNDEKFINAADSVTFRTRLEQDYQARLKLCHQVLCDCSTTALAQPETSWSAGFGLFDRLRQFHRLYHLGYPVFPDSDYTEFGIDPADITAANKRQQVTALFDKHITAAHTQLHTALNLPDAAMVGGCLPFYILARIRMAQLALWQKQNLLLSESYSTLTPFKKAWLAWRCRTRYQHLRE